MSRLFVIALLALLAGVGIVALIETEPGYLLIAYGGYTLETSFWVGILLIATAVLLLYTGLRFLARLIGSPGQILNWAGERRLRQAARLTSRGLINFMHGNWSRARKQLLRGARFGESPLLNYLLAARASYRLSEPEAMRRYLTQAAESDLSARVAVDLTQAELELHARQYEQALATLKRARRSRGKHPFVLHLLCKAYDGLGDLEALAALLPELRKHRVAGPVELDELEARVYRDLLEKAAVKGDAASLQALWRSYPARLRGDEAVQLHYLESLLACDETVTLEKEIVQTSEKALAAQAGRTVWPYSARKRSEADGRGRGLAQAARERSRPAAVYRQTRDGGAPVGEGARVSGAAVRPRGRAKKCVWSWVVC